MRHLPLFTIAVAIMVCPIFSGCSGAPSDFPKVASYRVIVKDGTTPIADALVVLTPESDSPLGRFTINGVTDSSGVAVVYTTLQNYSRRGAPAGEFRVTVRKDVPLPTGTRTPEETDSMDDRTRRAYEAELERQYRATPREVPERFSNVRTSRLTVTVGPGGGTFEVDVSQN
jgi:hypothetical protein